MADLNAIKETGDTTSLDTQKLPKGNDKMLTRMFTAVRHAIENLGLSQLGEPILEAQSSAHKHKKVQTVQSNRYTRSLLSSSGNFADNGIAALLLNDEGEATA